MTSPFSTNSMTLSQYFIGVTLPSINRENVIQESPIRWLKLSGDLTTALKHDHLPVEFLLDKLINVETGPHRKIRLARIVATTASDLTHMRNQSNVPTKSIKSFMGTRSQWIDPTRLLDDYLFETLQYLFHDYSLQEHLAIEEDAAVWQALLIKAKHNPQHKLMLKKDRVTFTHYRMNRKQHQTK